MKHTASVKLRPIHKNVKLLKREIFAEMRDVFESRFSPQYPFSLGRAFDELIKPVLELTHQVAQKSELAQKSGRSWRGSDGYGVLAGK